MSSEERVTRRELMTVAGAAGIGTLATAAHAGAAPTGAVPPSSASTGVQYSLVFVNDSTNRGDACVYQTDPQLGVPNAMSLAWFSKTAFPTTTVVFTWTIDYSFTWAETGELVPGVLYVASQTWAADLTKLNTVDFDMQDGAFTFSNERSEPPAGSLVIHESQNIPLNKASVGIGMSGAGTFAVQAQPSLNLTFTPHPKYWITFGNYTAGEVLDIQTLTNPVEIAFPANVYSMTAILNQQNQWLVEPTSRYNMEILRKRRQQVRSAR